MRIQHLTDLGTIELAAPKRGLDALLTQEALAGVLARERARTDRTGRPFTFVVFHVPVESLALRSIHRLALTALSRSRITDDVGWFGSDSIATLLPETPVEGARTFARAVLSAVQPHVRNLTYTIYVYPSDWYNAHAAGTPQGESGKRKAESEKEETACSRAEPALTRSNQDPPARPDRPSSGASAAASARPANRLAQLDRFGRSTSALLDDVADESEERKAESEKELSSRRSVAVATAPTSALESNPYSPISEVCDFDQDLPIPPLLESEGRKAKSENDTSAFRSPLSAFPLEPLFLRPLPAWKRAMDIAGASLGLLAASPVLLAAALAIKLTDHGPVLFVQKRAGLGGKPFDMYKLRSMYTDAEARKKELMHLNEQDGPAFKIRNDPRITPIGRFIRKTSIDELPQLINVLKGEMSLVGPRPPTFDEVAKYKLWYHQRLQVTPGITCIWQVYGRSKVSFEQWMRMDAQYVRTWGFWKDLKLILSTIPAVLFRKGAC